MARLKVKSAGAFSGFVVISNVSDLSPIRRSIDVVVPCSVLAFNITFISKTPDGGIITSALETYVGGIAVGSQKSPFIDLI